MKSETEMDLSEYVSDAKQYRDDDDDNEQIEIYEPSGEEGNKYRFQMIIFHNSILKID